MNRLTGRRGVLGMVIFEGTKNALIEQMKQPSVVKMSEKFMIEFLKRISPFIKEAIHVYVDGLTDEQVEVSISYLSDKEIQSKVLVMSSTMQIIGFNLGQQIGLEMGDDVLA